MFTQQQLFQYYFYYNPDTGLLYRHKKPEKPVGTIHVQGYLQCGYQDKILKVHRIIWIYVNGEISEGYEIDHINNIRTDNRINNLRLATDSENRQNSLKAKNNTSGTKGVWFHKQKNMWGARIRLDGKNIYEEYFPHKLAAEEAIKKAREYYHGEFANHG